MRHVESQHKSVHPYIVKWDAVPIDLHRYAMRCSSVYAAPIYLCRDTISAPTGSQCTVHPGTELCLVPYP